jgi:CubicO group peptidase (beta-lactamase class C family)
LEDALFHDEIVAEHGHREDRRHPRARAEENVVIPRVWRGLGLFVLAAFVIGGATLASRADELRIGTPAAVGISSERLARLDAAMEAEIAAGRKAGIVMLIARKGQIVHLKAYGMADIAANRKMQTDSMVRLYSMTKPITSVALLTLYEQGKFQLTDPLDKYIPGFANLKVVTGTRPDGSPLLEDVKRKPTIQDVFRHTAGFSYGFGSDGIDALYRKGGVDFTTMTSLADMIQKLAPLPLLYQPGERWVYSVSHDVQAFLVERFSGKPFDQYVRETILGPLKLTDIVFGVPRTHAARFTAMYVAKPGGGLQAVENADGSPVRGVAKWPLDAGYGRFTSIPFGGLSLSGTAIAYARFAQMLINGGELDGVRILSRKTVELMTMNHLPRSIPSIEATGDNGVGYGLGVSVAINPAREGALDSIGEFGWAGAATTKVWIDPKEQMIVVVLAQYMPFDPQFLALAQTMAYQAIID